MNDADLSDYCCRDRSLVELIKDLPFSVNIITKKKILFKLIIGKDAKVVNLNVYFTEISLWVSLFRGEIESVKMRSKLLLVSTLASWLKSFTLDFFLLLVVVLVVFELILSLNVCILYSELKLLATSALLFLSNFSLFDSSSCSFWLASM